VIEAPAMSRIFFRRDAGASFTAVIQLGTAVAVLLYFARDIGRILKAWLNGLFVAAHRTLDYWMGWYVIIGTIPIGVLGLLFKDEIRTGARNLWLIASALIIFSVVIAAAEFLGLDRELSARFGFLLAIPAVAWFLRFLVVLILLGAGVVSAT
jgi:undecaprenyl pyrophosphate phosphatase UppP